MLLNDKWYLFQSKTRIENLCDCSHRYNCCFGYCGRGSNSASAFWNSVQTRYFQTRVLFSWSLSWTCDCHLSRLHQRGSLCSGGWISLQPGGKKGNIPFRIWSWMNMAKCTKLAERVCDFRYLYSNHDNQLCYSVLNLWYYNS